MTVRRADGQYEDVATTKIVPGDVIVITQGSVASCDALLLNGSCVVNESMLTGKSNVLSMISISIAIQYIMWPVYYNT